MSNDLTEDQLEEQDSAPKRTPGELMDLMTVIRDERRYLAEKDSLLHDQWRALEAELLLLLDEQGMKRASNDNVTATVTVESVPNVQDWDEFLEFCRESDSMHLLQRRVATRAWRELLQADMPVPGVEPYSQRKISLRKRS